MAAILTRAAFRHVLNNASKRTEVTHAATAGGHGGGHKLWKKLFFFVGFPTIGLGMINAYLAHQAGLGAPQPEFVPYEYLRIRTKRFPWGDGTKSLFHNPHVNPLPNGYEH